MRNVQKHLLAWLGACMLAVLSVTVIAAAPGDVTPPNDIPATARYVDGQTHSIGANASLWYKFDYSAARDEDGHRDLATLTMVNANHTGLGFQVFTPAQIANWWQQTPVGQGTPQEIRSSDNVPATYGDAQSTNLSWVGSFVDTGTYYVRVTNINSSPMDFVLNLH